MQRGVRLVFVGNNKLRGGRPVVLLYVIDRRRADQALGCSCLEYAVCAGVGVEY